MKIEECEKMAEDFLRSRKGSQEIKITGVKRIDPNTIEVKGYCEDSRFTVELDTNLAEVVAYDFDSSMVTADPTSGVPYKPVRE